MSIESAVQGVVEADRGCAAAFILLRSEKHSPAVHAFAILIADEIRRGLHATATPEEAVKLP